MDIQTAYDRWSSAYDADKNITRDLDAWVTRTLFSDVSLSSVLEFGCGTGKNTSFFASVSQHVQALDISGAMLALAQESVTVPNVVFEQADISGRWPCADESHDLISCNLILQHVCTLDSVFSEASRTLCRGGQFFINELHPIKKYQGSMARYIWEGESHAIKAFDHQISHFVRAASQNGLKLIDLDEWWHEDDEGRPPRLVSMLFEKPCS